jgi:dTDP-L-rhamnose 4-epimerase
MNGLVLVTGGAGFIGSHLSDLLLASGYRVRALDSLDPQVHGEGRRRPPYLDPRIELVVGDVRDPKTVASALEGAEYLVHFAAAVGVGQSMYEITRYTSINSMGAAVVLEEALKKRDSLRKMLVASSMSIYGEGAYSCGSCGSVSPGLRRPEQLARHDWEMHCPLCGGTCTPVPTPETKPLAPTSVYAVGKRDHEELFLSVGDAYGIPVTAMRFFNVYGERQALSNPYTGVGAIFASRLLNGNSPVVFEDGGQSRDFIHVRDLVRGCLLALQNHASDGRVINLGTGNQVSILQVGMAIAKQLGRDDIPFTIRNQFRAGDIRHCFGDVSLAASLLGFKAGIPFNEGVRDLCSWVLGQTSVDMVDKATEELAKRGLAR